MATTPATKAAHQSVYLRSFKIPVPKAAVAPKVSQALGELGIVYSRLVMPTRDNCTQLEALLEATTALVEIKKVADKIDFDIQVMKAKLKMTGEGADKAQAGDKGADVANVDQATEGKATDGGARAQSVVSTRSGVSRKQVSVVSDPYNTLNSFHIRLDVQVLYHRQIQQGRYQREQRQNDRNEVKG